MFPSIKLKSKSSTKKYHDRYGGTIHLAKKEAQKRVSSRDPTVFSVGAQDYVSSEELISSMSKRLLSLE